MFDSLDKLEEAVNECINNNDLNQALGLIQNFVFEIINFYSCTGVIFGSRVLDELCQKIGWIALNKNDLLKDSNFSNPYTENDPETVIYVATTLYPTGGHTAVIEEFIQFQPNKKHTILLTDIEKCT